MIQFQSTLSLRRATHSHNLQRPVPLISIHALLAESDTVSGCGTSSNENFNPRSPCGERPGRVLLGPHRQDISIHALLAESDVPQSLHDVFSDRFQSTLSLRRATGPLCHALNDVGISIHALLAESDLRRGGRPQSAADFNPRSPCGERRPGASRYRAAYTDFNPRSPCGERLSTSAFGLAFLSISIHALLAESDVHGYDFRVRVTISIHALLAESDGRFRSVPLEGRYFNPRSPCGERPRRVPVGRPAHSISIHALLAESDSRERSRTTPTTYFNPRSPCGERPVTPPVAGRSQHFNPRSPCGERHHRYLFLTLTVRNFNPRSPCGERQHTTEPNARGPRFQSTLSLRRATANTTKLALSFLSKVPI